jgi:hypothetical protein
MQANSYHGGVKLELEGDQLVEGARVRRVVPQQRHEELVTIQLALERVLSSVL